VTGEESNYSSVRRRRDELLDDPPFPLEELEELLDELPFPEEEEEEEDPPFPPEELEEEESLLELEELLVESRRRPRAERRLRTGSPSSTACAAKVEVARAKRHRMFKTFIMIL